MAQSDFFENVYEVVKLVPVGRVTTYGAIAAYLGSKRGARMVGWAMNNAHGRPDVPAHRVVNRNGVLTGKNFFGSSTEMQELLEADGVKIEGDQLVAFKECFWDPGIELL
ncbi:MGMT family protein [Persicitalea jodogahamensis]|uniref:Methylated-DNA--protein-cysteine methyltransferase n=1 Tax=Persicitalea jodogahamensis TaxID=402147 RepID=A0A8J3G935_9BACT|nr:MGMT family protein [Persicitalea jodogahamensis]GHB60358.1 methylated-DNA--protein-cysteine methyltransferase [Persicitalea jodogahamensis]